MAISNDTKFTLARVRNTAIAWIPLFDAAGTAWRLLRDGKRWRTTGWSVPPPYFVKRAMLLTEASRIGAVSFVETGTYLGDTVWAMRNRFKQIYSLEVQPQLARIASKRFRRYPHIQIVQGDSAFRLQQVLPKVAWPLLLWLDGHYSAGLTGRGITDCPVIDELKNIVRAQAGVYSVFIDDARCFGVDAMYPSIAELADFTRSSMPAHVLSVQNDIICIQPK